MRTVPDMDCDKLLDIKEATIGTDALNPDTDGDGYEDGHEVLTTPGSLSLGSGARLISAQAESLQGQAGDKGSR